VNDDMLYDRRLLATLLTLTSAYLTDAYKLNDEEGGGCGVVIVLVKTQRLMDEL
jgi:hypothetical protein